MNRIKCPLCDWFHDDQGPNRDAIDPMALAGVFGHGVFAAHARASHAQELERIIDAHFKTHTTVDWLRKVTAQAATIEALNEQNAEFLDQARGGLEIDHDCPAVFACAYILCELTPESEQVDDPVLAARGRGQFTDGHSVTDSIDSPQPKE